MSNQLLLTVEEAAERLGLRRSKTYELVIRGELGSIKIGKCRRVPVQLLEQYISRLIVQQAAQPEPQPWASR